MNKNLLIETCICTAGVLILCSLSNVIGYQSIHSTTQNNSPLFQTRTQKAINQQQNSITSEYLGKGEINNLLILPRNITNSYRKITSKIQTMDEITFHRFIDYAINQINDKYNLRIIDVNNFIKVLYRLRESDQNITMKKETQEDRLNFTYRYNYEFTICWTPGCYLYDLILLIILFIFLDPPTTNVPECHP